MCRSMKLFALLVLMPVLAACTTMEQRTDGPTELQHACMYGGGVSGAAIGGALGNVPGAAAGAAVGGVMGAFACWDTSEPESRPAKEPEPQSTEPLDSDGDGVPDSRDWCAGTEAGVEVDENGCPLDSDGDGVPDTEDRCPNTAAGTRVDEHGCAVVGTKLFTLEGVHFAFDSAELRPGAEQRLDEAVRKLTDNKQANVAVIGHTDSIGTESYNQDLSLRRARSVVDYLTSHGVDSHRLRIDGRGESEPIATNETREGRAMNRRVEFVVEK